MKTSVTSNTDRLLNALKDSAAGRAAQKTPEEQAVGTVENVDAVRLSSDLNLQNDRKAKVEEIKAAIEKEGIQKGYFAKRDMSAIAEAVGKELFLN